MLKKYFHPFSGKIIFWNILLFVFVKLVFPYSAFQFASLIGPLPIFDSRDIITITNEIRSTNQLKSLKANALLDLAAEEKLNDMALNEYFAHTSPSGITPWFWIKKAEYQYRIAGENLAIGFTTPKDTVQAWLKSQSHKANLLNPQYQDMGVAVKGVKIKENQGILVVQMFGVQTQTGKPIDQKIINPTPIYIPTPITIPNLSPALSPIVVTAETKGETAAPPDGASLAPEEREVAVSPEIKTQEITIQYVSTDTQIPTVDKPSPVQFQNIEKIQQWTRVLNNTFIAYALASVFLSVIAFFFIEKNRYMALKMSLHAVIFTLAILLPTVKLTFEAFIF